MLSYWLYWHAMAHLPRLHTMLLYSFSNIQGDDEYTIFHLVLLTLKVCERLANF